MKKLLLTVALLSAFGVANAAPKVTEIIKDGSINFTGVIKDETCFIRGATNNQITVNLGEWEPSEVIEVGASVMSSSKNVPFIIDVECPLYVLGDDGQAWPLLYEISSLNLSVNSPGLTASGLAIATSNPTVGIALYDINIQDMNIDFRVYPHHSSTFVDNISPGKLIARHELAAAYTKADVGVVALPGVANATVPFTIDTY